jgi:hypothetical protein
VRRVGLDATPSGIGKPLHLEVAQEAESIWGMAKPTEAKQPANGRVQKTGKCLEEPP